MAHRACTPQNQDDPNPLGTCIITSGGTWPPSFCHLTPRPSLPCPLSSGVVTPAMLSIDKRPLVAVGGCEALAQLLFMAGAAHIPGPLLPVVNQTYLVWSLVVASVLLGARCVGAFRSWTGRVGLPVN